MNILLILAGSPPGLDLLISEMTLADITIAVDGGANVFRQAKLQPDLIIGDFDSIEQEFIESVNIIKRQDQNFTDLQKALTYVFEHYQPEHLTLLGATGGRTDHLINNLQICAAIDPSVNITIKNDDMKNRNSKLETIIRITPNSGATVNIEEGTVISVIAVSEFTGLHSKGMKWEICGVNSKDGLISQSNVANVNDPKFTIVSGCVYLAVYQ